MILIFFQSCRGTVGLSQPSPEIIIVERARKREWKNYPVEYSYILFIFDEYAYSLYADSGPRGKHSCFIYFDFYQEPRPPAYIMCSVRSHIIAFQNYYWSTNPRISTNRFRSYHTVVLMRDRRNSNRISYDIHVQASKCLYKISIGFRCDQVYYNNYNRVPCDRP